MDFSFTPEQQMLEDATRRFIREQYGFDVRKRVRASADGWSRELWLQLAELGLLALNIPEENGGLAAGPIGTMLVSSAVGEGLLLEPFLSSAVMATHVIAEAASPEQRSRWFPSMGSGALIAVLLHDERGRDLSSAAIHTTATKTRDGWEISGRKPLVYHASTANLLLVSARVGDELGLFATSMDCKGMTLIRSKTVDEQPAASVVFDRVHVPVESCLSGDVRQGLQRAVEFGLAALCAEAVGVMDRVLAATIEYSRSRVQFGKPIATFQALRHRMADMHIAVEQARSMCYLAASSCTGSDTQSRSKSLSAAKVLMGQAARFIGQQAVQLHGAMGMTDELEISHYFKRLLAFELRFGTSQEHLEAYSRQFLA